MTELPIVILGAGPQGLALAAHLVARGIEPVVLERGDAAADAVRQWGHVRLFSAWDELTDAAARRLLEPTGWTQPARGYPTGAEWVADYLAPLAAVLGDRIRVRHAVTAVTRLGRDKMVSSGRSEQPLVVHVDADGVEQRLLARAVVDATGTWDHPSPAGAEGVPAIGERAARTRLTYRIPSDVESLAGAHVVVVGAGHSAVHAVLQLDALARRHPTTRITWVLRRGAVDAALGGGSGDELPQRAALGGRARAAIDAGRVEVVPGFRVAEIVDAGAALTLIADDGREVRGAAHAFVLTGFRPDLAPLSELRLDLDPTLDAVGGIAASIDPNLHSCGSVGATGARELEHPEPGFFIVGAKSYGRAPTFLALTGYEQVRSVAAYLAGDHVAAASRELVLPDTGVCGGARAFDAPADSCCTTPTPVRLGSLPAAVDA